MLIRALLLTIAVTLVSHAQTFGFKHVMVSPGNKLFVSTTGTPDSATISMLTDPAHYNDWHVTAKERTTSSAPTPPPGAPGTASKGLNIDVTQVKWYAASQTFELAYAKDPLTGRDPQEFGWTIFYAGAPVPLNATLNAPNGFFSPAKSKDDADIYFLGSYLAGESTKPIYSIDAKVNWVPEIHDSGYFFGLESTVLVNSSSTPTANSVDPDSITAGLALRFMRGDFKFDIAPARGEFCRKYPESSFVPAATAKWVLNPLFDRANDSAVFYPSIGMEAGRNLNKPNILFKQPVNLSGYDAIARGVVGAYAAYYVKKTKPNPNDPYQVEFYSNYTARIPSTDEPFVTSNSINGKSQSIVRLRTNVRHYLESGILWNASELVGIQIKYAYGSLPPLFQFLDNQVTVGITFKAKLPDHF